MKDFTNENLCKIITALQKTRNEINEKIAKYLQVLEKSDGDPNKIRRLYYWYFTSKDLKSLTMPRKRISGPNPRRTKPVSTRVARRIKRIQGHRIKKEGV